MKETIGKLTVLKELADDALISALYNAEGKNETDDEYCALLREVYGRGAETNLAKYVEELVVRDENAFSLTCARKKKVSYYLFDAYASDVKSLLKLLKSFSSSSRFALGNDVPPFDDEDIKTICKKLKTFYSKRGFGDFIYSKAFTYEDGKLVPVKTVSPIKLEDLKNYESEKEAIINNVSDFLKGLPYSHMLLYGDKGTGKSSTMHAILNAYWRKGLRIIELNKENMLSLPAIREEIADNPLKFIVFIDDLSLGEYDDKVSSLKTCFEGSISGGSGNVMIVATSNRRHIIKESFSDRENSVHPNDSMEEQLSLSDRFGLTVMFSSTDKAGYLSIVKQLAEDKKIKTEKERLFTLAERWALIKGGRSPRRAAQFIDLVYSCEKSGREIDF